MYVDMTFIYQRRLWYRPEARKPDLRLFYSQHLQVAGTIDLEGSNGHSEVQMCDQFLYRAE